MKKQCLICHVPDCSLEEGQSILDCPIHKFLAVLGKKRGMLVLLMLETPQRYGELKKLIPDITEKMLITTLAALEHAGYISKEKITGKQVSSTYTITTVGKKALTIAQDMAMLGKLLPDTKK